MSIQYIHRVSEKLATDLGLSEKLSPSPVLAGAAAGVPAALAGAAAV